MPLNLSEKSIARLERLLLAALDSVGIGKTGGIVYKSDLFNSVDAALGQQSREAINRIFGEDGPRFPLFAVDWISRRVAKAKAGGNETKPRLDDNDGFRDLNAIARQIATDFNQLPYSYTLSFAFPTIPTPLDGLAAEASFDEGKFVRLHDIDDAFLERYARGTAEAVVETRPTRGMLMALLAPRLPEQGVCLQVDIDGFVDRFGKGPTAVEAVDRIASFFGLALAFYIVKVGPIRQANYLGAEFYGRRESAKTVFIHRSGSDAPIGFDTMFETDADFAELVDRLDAVANYGSMTPDEIVSLQARGLLLIRNAFAAGEKGARVRRAAHWLFDSYVGTNQLLQFVQAMVALEILLGDKKQSTLVGLMELLRNRCAYLLGESQTEREEILAQFNKIYEVRSQIVHSGQSRLSEDDRKLFLELRRLCSRVLRKEVTLLDLNQSEQPVNG